MLKYLRKYSLLYYLVALVPALIYLMVSYVSGGVGAFFSLRTWIAVVALIVICSFFAGRVFNRLAIEETQKMIYLFYQECDPESFLSNSSDIVKHIRAPFDEWASMLMGAYALANIDVDNTEAATKAVEDMRVSAQAAKKGQSMARICLNMHAAINALYGPDLALKCLHEAQHQLQTLGSKEDPTEEIQMINQHQALYIAEKLHDYQEVIKLNLEIYQNDRLLSRIRVLAAYQIALAYGRLGNTDQELRFLEYVVEHGNKLAVVEKARNLLTHAQPSNG